MNKLFIKIDRYIDYNNHYSLYKALNTLSKEFELSISKRDKYYSRAVLDAAKKVHEKLSLTYRESEDYGETMSYPQKVMSNKFRGFIATLINRMRSEFNEKIELTS